MADETDTTSEVARVLGEHYPDQTSYDAGDLQGCMCGWQVPAPRTYGESDWAAYYAHQAAMLAEAGLLRPQIAASVPAGQPAAGSAGRGGSGGLEGPQIVVGFTADTSKFKIGMLRHQVALLKRQIDQANTARTFAQRAASREHERADAAEAQVEAIRAAITREAAHGDAITRCNLVAERFRTVLDGVTKPETNEEGA